MRSETLRTVTPSSASTAAVIWSACVDDNALADRSTIMNVALDSTTSKAVITPPARPTAPVRSPAADDDGGAATRMVIE